MYNQEDDLELMKQLFDEAYSELNAINEQRAALKDRSNTDGPSPRPTDSFIDDNLGPQKSHVEIASLAQEKAAKRFQALKAKERLESEKAKEIEKPKIYREKDAEFQAKLDAFREREAKANRPLSDEDKAQARDDFNRATQEQNRDQGRER